MKRKRKNIILILIYILGMQFLPPLVRDIVMHAQGYTREDLVGNFNLVALVNFVAYIVLFTILLFFTYKTYIEDFKKIKSWGNFCKQMGLGLFFTFGSAMVGNLLVMSLGTVGQAANQSGVQSAMMALPAFMLITVVFFGPVVEEIVFRQALMNIFKWKPIFNVLLSSFLFGYIHVRSGGFIHIIPYFLMGLVFAVMYQKNKNICHVTVLHILHNGLTAALMLLAHHILAAYM